MIGMNGGELVFAIAVGLGLDNVATLIRVHSAEFSFIIVACGDTTPAFAAMALGFGG